MNTQTRNTGEMYGTILTFASLLIGSLKTTQSLLPQPYVKKNHPRSLEQGIVVKGALQDRL